MSLIIKLLAKMCITKNGKNKKVVSSQYQHVYSPFKRLCL